LENLLTAPFPVSAKAEEIGGGAGVGPDLHHPGPGCSGRRISLGPAGLDVFDRAMQKTSGESNGIMSELDWGERTKGTKERETREKKTVLPRRQFL
jgi:hypothetical protein